MECTKCEKEIKSDGVAGIETIEGKEVVCIYIICEHCKQEYYGVLSVCKLESI